MDAKRRQNRYNYTGTSYIEGNTVRKLNPVPDIRREERTEVAQPRRQEHRTVRYMSGMNFATLLVLTMAIIATLTVCVDFLKLQTKVSNTEKSIVTLEKDLTTLTNENDAAFAAANAPYDLDYIYKIAVEELGMVYPKDNTVITYEPGSDEYVRQYEDIPNN